MKPYITIKGKKIGNDSPPYIIGEIGINHNGSIDIARRLIDISAQHGADCIKFQKRDFEELYPKRFLENTEKYDQQIQYTIFAQKRAELSIEELAYLKNYAENKGLDFLCTAFDIKSLKILEELNLDAYKISSADLTNFILLDYVSSKQKPILLSTGMSTFEEIKKTVNFLKSKNAEFALLHCNSTYPAMFEDINLKFIETLKNFGVPVGYSGHERGIAVSLAATFFGACIIERHITLDRTMQGPDHAASLEPEGLHRLIRDIRNIRTAIGYEKGYLSRGEIFNRNILGKSLITTRAIRKGEIITREMLTAKSPAKGISPQYFFDFIGKKAFRDFKEEEYLKDSDLGIQEKQILINPCYNWGFIVRFPDYKYYLPYKPKFFEFHFSDQDLSVKIDNWFSDSIDAELVIHAPTNWGDDVMDISSENQLIQKKSIESLERTIEIAHDMAKYFLKQKGKSVKMVLHVPGFSQFEEIKDNNHLYDNASEVLKSINFEGIELLLENLPPNGWYYGGHSYLNLFCDPREIREFLEKEKLKMTFDTSHAGMFVNCLKKEKIDVSQFYDYIKHLIRHVHIADTIGIMGEGLQIGEGMINFSKFLPELIKTNVTYSPEIWLGHNFNGKGFKIAFNKIRKIIKK